MFVIFTAFMLLRSKKKIEVKQQILNGFLTSFYISSAKTIRVNVRSTLPLRILEALYIRSSTTAIFIRLPLFTIVYALFLKVNCATKKTTPLQYASIIIALCLNKQLATLVLFSKRLIIELFNYHLSNNI